MHRRLILAALTVPLLFGSALAGPRDDVLAGIQRCQVIQDDRTWLDCMYGAHQPMRARLGLPPAPDSQQRLVPPVVLGLAPEPRVLRAAPPPVVPHRSPSMMQILGGTAPPVAVSTLAQVRYDNGGAFIVTLDNGQVWHQVDAVEYPKPRMKIGARVTVTPGALWSYNLKTDDSSHVYKVERRT